MNKPMGIAEYQLAEALPKDLKASLPSIEQFPARIGVSKPARKPRRDSDFALCQSSAKHIEVVMATASGRSRHSTR
jgi:hypothetical protein